MDNDEQAYPLAPRFEHGDSDLSVPLRITYTGYYNFIHLNGPIHARPNSWYLQLMNYRQNPGSDPRTLETGQFVLRRPNESYVLHLPKGEQTGYYWIFFTGNYVEQLILDCELVPNRVYDLQAESLQIIRQDFALLFAECARKKACYEPILNAQLMTILAHLGRGRQTALIQRNENVRSRLEKSLLYMQSNLSDSSLTVELLASRTRLSVSRYRELFREHVGVSPREYLIQQRINHACNLLQNTALTISQIANYCGYQEISDFSRLFHKKTGMTPTEYRRRHTDT